MYTASSSEDTLSTVSRRSAPASSMRYLALAHSRVSSLYQADSMSGVGTSHWNTADAFSGTSRSCRRFLKGSVGSAEEGPDEWGGEGKRGRPERRQRLGRLRASRQELTSHDDEHRAVGLAHEVGRRAGVEATV
ncbi:hypothetical protein Celaphus_00002900 [Cervus elaphus hippelaphus]|uniref:Uncharacterized protein n=1 Tax=Cervus elaphus hippelaphus TaxID=46360 RepID=A0A212D1F9_CEREH|nr:hypothetical protein Celaphus_00002900 [Cervus elaphus hippelaphus]